RAVLPKSFLSYGPKHHVYNDGQIPTVLCKSSFFIMSLSKLPCLLDEQSAHCNNTHPKNNLFTRIATRHNTNPWSHLRQKLFNTNTYTLKCCTYNAIQLWKQKIGMHATLEWNH
ncbi:hypothetical protein LOAG_15783, partial [Loa loa]